MATHSSILWRIPGTEEPGGLQFRGSQLDTTERLTLSFSESCINPFLCLFQLLEAAYISRLVVPSLFSKPAE